MPLSSLQDNKPTPRRGGRTHLRKLKKLIQSSPQLREGDNAERLIHLPAALADYLVTSVSELEAGKDLITAFALSKPRGQRKKRRRDLFITMAVLDLCKNGQKITSAIAAVAKQVNMTDVGVRTAYRKGKDYVQIINELNMQRDTAMDRRRMGHLELWERGYSAETAIQKAIEAKKKPKKYEP